LGEEENALNEPKLDSRFRGNDTEYCTCHGPAAFLLQEGPGHPESPELPLDGPRKVGHDSGGFIEMKAPLSFHCHPGQARSARAGIQFYSSWIPAFAGMTMGKHQGNVGQREGFCGVSRSDERRVQEVRER
jgi:hypothetical protein